MKHSELKPGDMVVIRGSVYGRGKLTRAKVVRVTPQTLVVVAHIMDEIYQSIETRIAHRSRDRAYMPDQKIEEEVKRLNDEIEALEKQRAVLVHGSLDKVVFE